MEEEGTHEEDVLVDRPAVFYLDGVEVGGGPEEVGGGDLRYNSG